MNPDFDDLIENFLNGNISDTKKQVKELTPYERYELIEYIQEMNLVNMAKLITRWCVIGEFK